MHNQPGYWVLRRSPAGYPTDLLDDINVNVTLRSSNMHKIAQKCAASRTSIPPSASKASEDAYLRVGSVAHERFVITKFAEPLLSLVNRH